LIDPAEIKMGFGHYDEMCISCHGAPGIDPDEISEGLWPKAPNLSKTVKEWTPEELFWITKNGVKFTAMPGWGPSHSDKMIWAMVAFMEKLPTLSPADYKKLKNEAGPNEDGEHK
jgi:mono/diheme cytochrome c family protein